jgi:hypothetical protein
MQEKDYERVLVSLAEEFGTHCPKN